MKSLCLEYAVILKIRLEQLGQLISLHCRQVFELHSNTGDLPGVAPFYHHLNAPVDGMGIGDILEANPDILSCLPLPTGENKTASRRNVLGYRTLRSFAIMVFGDKHREVDAFPSVQSNLLREKGSALAVNEIEQGAPVFLVKMKTMYLARLPIYLQIRNWKSFHQAIDIGPIIPDSLHFGGYIKKQPMIGMVANFCAQVKKG